MKQFNGEVPDIVASVTYDALHILIDAVKAGQKDPQRVKAYLYQMPVYAGTTGPTKFDRSGDVISKPIAIHFYENGLSRLATMPTAK
jgi:ABC-type branched-subunit amino acid transport system substrate-binding protein